MLLQHVLSKLIIVTGDLRAEVFGSLGKVLTACFHRVGSWNMEEAKTQLYIYGEAMKFMTQVLQGETQRVGDAAELSPGTANLYINLGLPALG